MGSVGDGTDLPATATESERRMASNSQVKTDSAPQRPAVPVPWAEQPGLLPAVDAAGRPLATAPGISVFFPAYNDGGTIASLVIEARPPAAADRRLRDHRRGQRQHRLHRRGAGGAGADLRAPARPPHRQPPATAARCSSASPPPPRNCSSTPTATGSTTRATGLLLSRADARAWIVVNGYKISAPTRSAASSSAASTTGR